MVLGDEIHAARFATKLHTSKSATFAPPGAGPLGEVAEDRVDICWRPAWEDELGVPETLDDSRVETVRAPPASPMPRCVRRLLPDLP